MSDDNSLALRVVNSDEVDLGETITVEFPRYLAIHLPCLGETIYADLDGVANEKIVAKMEHGASQIINDAGNSKGKENARAEVAKKVKIFWAEGRVASDPLTSEMWAVSCAILKATNPAIKVKELPTLKSFPDWFAGQEESDQAAIRQEATTRLAAKRAAAEKAKSLGAGLKLKLK